MPNRYARSKSLAQIVNENRSLAIIGTKEKTLFFANRDGHGRVIEVFVETDLDPSELLTEALRLQK